MKKYQFTSMAILLIALILTSCQKTDIAEEESVAGIYTGTLTYDTDTKSLNDSGKSEKATVEISEMGNNLLEVHCYNEAVDTTFTLNYYNHNEQALVCYTGNEFEARYGHELGESHSVGGMMKDMGAGETEWMHHLNDEHSDDDEHYGGFNMQNHSFRYRFEIEEEGNIHSLEFYGTK